jgi:tRNA threonylcarbamoyladenosine biosynthesis protein TsaE
MENFETYSSEETTKLGEKFSSRLQSGDIVALCGELGAGKTSFVQGICKGLGIHEHVASPTFTIVNEYNSGKLIVYHFDFYRMKSTNELREIGFEEYLNGNGICLIEWADRIQEFLPAKRFDVKLELGVDYNTRRIEIEEISL